MHNKQQVTGLVLAGGAGRRVQGRDKGLILWQGKPMIAHLLQRLRPQVETLMISCNRNIDQYQAYGFSLVVDQRPDYQGPLAGIEAAIKHAHNEFLLITACDMPLLPEDLVARLLHPLLQSDNQTLDVSIAHDGVREQYLCAILRRRCLDSLSGHLASGHRAVRHWYALQQCITVDFSDRVDAFKNYNRME